MDEISSFVKKIKSVFIVKKNDFDLSKHQICFVGCKKKKGFVMTKIQIYFVLYIYIYIYIKEVIFDDKNSNLFYYIFKKKRFSKKKTSLII